MPYGLHGLLAVLNLLELLLVVLACWASDTRSEH